LISIAGWAPAPAHPALGADEAAVWRVSPAMQHPIEKVAAQYLQAPVRVTRTPAGKPELEESDLGVSLAHSGEVVLVAIAQAREVGVDVEVLRSDAARWSLVSHALTERERQRLDVLDAPTRAESFLRVWTRKEAILKAAGTGLGIDPRRLELDDLDVVAVPRQLGQANDWTLADVPLAGYAATIALKGRLSSLLLFDAES
jgi:4'-phosphopantetheinyl transferase